MRFGKTVTGQHGNIERLMKRAIEVEALAVQVYDDELYLVFFAEGKRPMKIPAEWATGAVENFLDDVREAMKRDSH